MAISRTSLVRGPSKNSFAGVTCYSKEDFGIKLTKETFEITTSPGGKVDERVINVMAEATLVPEGRWSNALIAAWFTPFANMIRGDSLLTGADRPFVASAKDGQIHTMVAAAITKLPEIFLSAKKTLLGSMTFKGYRALAADWTTASSLYTIATSGGTITDATFTPAGIVVQPYLATWGSVAGFSAFDTEAGWTISFNIGVKEIETDGAGKIEVTFDKIEVMAKCVPVGPTASNILAAANLQGLSGTNGMTRGYSLQNDGSGGVTPDLVITGADGATTVTLKAANIKTGGYEFGASKLRDGEIGFVSTRPYTAGAQQPIFAMTAPS